MMELRNDAKAQIIDILRKDGYATYATLVSLFDIYLTDDANTIAYMIPKKAAIVLNKELGIDQVSFIIRHEILHEYLTHFEREQKFRKDHPDKIFPSDNQLANIAADFEISDVGYTEKDKITAKSIAIGDKILSGLVVEYDRPDLVGKSFEEIYDTLLKEDESNLDELKNQLQSLNDLDQGQLDDIEKQIDGLINQVSNNQQQPSNNSNQQSSSNSSQQQSSSSNNTRNINSQPSNSSNQTGNGDNVNSNQNNKSDISNILDKAKDQIDNLQNELDNLNNKSNKPFDTDEIQKRKVDIATRARIIQDALRDDKLKDKIDTEIVSNIRKQKLQKKASTKKSETYIRNIAITSIPEFERSLNRFFKNTLGDEEDYSYSKINPSYAQHGFLVPDLGPAEKSIPKIFVYHDVSISFDDPAKTAAAMSAINTLYKYEKQKKLKIVKKYFATEVSDSRKGAGSSTRGQPILEDIERYKPENVIIITDSDINDCTKTIKVKGAVWLIFYDSVSMNLVDHISGKLLTKYCLIDYREK